MPLLHSHQFLCVPARLLTITVTRLGFAGSVTSQISWAALPNVRSRYTLLVSARRSSLGHLAAVRADGRDSARALSVDERLICASALQSSSPTIAMSCCSAGPLLTAD